MDNENKAEDYFRSLKAGLNDFSQRVTQAVDDMFRGDMEGSEFRVPTDIYETESQMIVEFELPGMTKADVKIQVVEDILQIKGNKKREGSEARTYRLRERKFGEFIRSVPLPEYVELSNIKANFEKGLLQVKFPLKREIREEQGTSIDIE